MSAIASSNHVVLVPFSFADFSASASAFFFRLESQRLLHLPPFSPSLMPAKSYSDRESVSLNGIFAPSIGLSLPPCLPDIVMLSAEL